MLGTVDISHPFLSQVPDCRTAFQLSPLMGAAGCHHHPDILCVVHCKCLVGAAVYATSFEFSQYLHFITTCHNFQASSTNSQAMLHSNTHIMFFILLAFI